MYNMKPFLSQNTLIFRKSAKQIHFIAWLKGIGLKVTKMWHKGDLKAHAITSRAFTPA